MWSFIAAGLLALPTVVIDPGHGGAQTGAKGICGVLEKDVTLGISRQVEGLLSATGRVEVLMTRERDIDVPLEARADLANLAGADAFISIHANASKRADVRGVETYFLSRKSASRQLASLVQRENEGSPLPLWQPDSSLNRILVSLKLGSAHRQSRRLASRMQGMLERELGVQGRGVLQAPFLVLTGNHTAAALVEVGFLTHPEECEMLKDPHHQHRLAKAIAAAALFHVGEEAPPSAMAKK